MNEISRDTLFDLYCTQQLTSKEIASLIGMSQRQIERRISRYGIKKTPHYNKPDHDTLYRLYWDENKGTPEISLLCNCSARSVNNWLRDYGIPLRSNSQAQYAKNGLERPSKDTLYALYINQQKPQQEIGVMFNVSQGTAGKWLRDYAIPIRTYSERASGENNPMYGKTHTEAVKEATRQRNKSFFDQPGMRERYAIQTCEQIAAGKTGKSYNKLETRVAKMLDVQNITYTQQYRLGRYLFDFCLPDTNTLLEVHGTFWHADPRVYPIVEKWTPIQQRNKANDIKKALRAIKDGYSYRVLWALDIP